MRRIAALTIVLALVTAPTALGAAWSVQPTPTPAREASSGLTDVSCGSNTSCVAVGESFDSAFRTHAFSERWDGSAWTLRRLAGLPKSGQSSLPGVSCVSATWCTAVGWQTPRHGKQRLLAEHWNGTRWSVQRVPSPNPNKPTQELDSISCTSVRACVAVGYFGRETYTPLTGYTDTFSGLIEHWNGHRWRVQHVIHTPYGVAQNLVGVSCRSASACVAVGHSSSPDPGIPLAWRWNGHHWVKLHPPNHGEWAELLAVSCPASRACMAVGHWFVSREQNTLSERWDGIHWHVRTPSVPAYTGGAVLTGVSCLAISDCVAVGGAGNVDPSGSLADHWDGKHWTVMPTPGQDGWGLNQVTCRTTFCIAVGSRDNSTLAEVYR